MRFSSVRYILLLLPFLAAVASCDTDNGSYDYYTEAFEFYGEYNGVITGGDEHNYYICLSDFGFDEQGYIRQGATYYYFDIFSSAPSGSGSTGDILLPEGTYTLGVTGATAMGTFTRDYSIFVGEDRYGVPIEQTFTEGTLSVTRSSASSYIIEAELTDLSGMTHYVRYNGPAVMTDHSSIPDEELMILDKDLTVDATAVYAAINGLYDPQGNITNVIISLTDMPVNGDNEVTPPGSILNIDCYMRLTDDGQIPAGTYSVLPTPQWGTDHTLSPGEVYSGSLVGTLVEHYGDDGKASLGLITSGEMSIEISPEKDYGITFSFTTDHGCRITGGYNGPIDSEYSSPSAHTAAPLSVKTRLHRPVPQPLTISAFSVRKDRTVIP